LLEGLSCGIFCGHVWARVSLNEKAFTRPPLANDPRIKYKDQNDHSEGSIAPPEGATFSRNCSVWQYSLRALLVLCVPALARDNGQYNSVAPEVRQWFRAQKSPKTGGLCCNEADGTYAEEDIRNGVYWTRFESTKGEWIPVPADVVIKDPNRNGAPVAWWYFQGGKLQIRCYAPGGGV
jgi:hypothetical protein